MSTWGTERQESLSVAVFYGQISEGVRSRYFDTTLK